MWIAFVLFLVAGVSDAVDGFLAKRFRMTTVLGSYLDPLADKALLVSIYVTLGINGQLPRWLVILVVSRDVMIVGGVMLSWLVGSPVKMKPLIDELVYGLIALLGRVGVNGVIAFGGGNGLADQPFDGVDILGVRLGRDGERLAGAPGAARTRRARCPGPARRS